MPILQLFVLSPRGDKIISKDYRPDAVRGTDEVFFRKYKFWDGTGGDTPPFFSVDGIHYGFVKKNNLLLVVTTRDNMSPALLAELLIRLTKLLKDFLGVLNEEALRKNFVMVYEILDEVIDYGFLQGTSSEKLKPYIANEPIPVDDKPFAPQLKPSTFNPFGGKGIKTPAETEVSIISGERAAKNNEIYVDVLERLNAVFNANGTVLSAEVDGAIVMKSFLSGTPELHLALNEDLTIGRNERTYGGVVLDSVNFHECINYNDFESERTLCFRPPDGEFVAMNYRVTSVDNVMPFKMLPLVDNVSPYKVELSLQVCTISHSFVTAEHKAVFRLCEADLQQWNFPANVEATTVVVRFAVPKNTTSVGIDVLGPAQQTYEYKSAEKTVVWLIKKFKGDTKQICRARMSFSQPTTQSIRREIGPISMNFEIP
eukprot:gene10337-15909_t